MAYRIPVYDTSDFKRTVGLVVYSIFGPKVSPVAIHAVCQYRHSDKFTLSERKMNLSGGTLKLNNPKSSPTSNPSPPGKARAGESHRPSAFAHLSKSELYMLRAILSRAHRREYAREENLPEMHLL